MDRKVRLHGRLLQLAGVNVHPDLEGLRRKVFPVVADQPDIEAATEDQEDVRILEHKVARAVADRAAPARERRMVVGQQVIAVPCGDDGDAQVVR